MTDIRVQAEIDSLKNQIAELSIQNHMLVEKCDKYRNDAAKNSAAVDFRAKIASLITVSGYEPGGEVSDWEDLVMRLLKTGIDFDIIMNLVKSNHMLMSEWEKFMVAIRLAEK